MLSLIEVILSAIVAIVLHKKEKYWWQVMFAWFITGLFGILISITFYAPIALDEFLHIMLFTVMFFMMLLVESPKFIDIPATPRKLCEPLRESIHSLQVTEKGTKVKGVLFAILGFAGVICGATAIGYPIIDGAGDILLMLLGKTNWLNHILRDTSWWLRDTSWWLEDNTWVYFISMPISFLLLFSSVKGFYPKIITLTEKFINIHNYGTSSIIAKKDLKVFYGDIKRLEIKYGNVYAVLTSGPDILLFHINAFENGYKIVDEISKIAKVSVAEKIK